MQELNNQGQLDNRYLHLPPQPLHVWKQAGSGGNSAPEPKPALVSSSAGGNPASLSPHQPSQTWHTETEWAIARISQSMTAQSRLSPRQLSQARRLKIEADKEEVRRARQRRRQRHADKEKKQRPAQSRPQPSGSAVSMSGRRRSLSEARCGPEQLSRGSQQRTQK